MPLNPTAQDKTGIVLANFDGTADAENYPLGDKPEPSVDITDLAVTSKTAASVTLGWTGIDEVVALERAVTPGSFTEIQGGIAVNSTEVTNSGLSDGTEYHYRLTFASGTSNTVTVTTNAASVLPASYQLSAGNYSPRNVDPHLIYPRPDTETAAWTKHRRHYPGIAYRVPIGVAFGAGPLVYEIISAPSGATIGEFLVVDGDRLVPNEDYGVLKWGNPTAGTHSFHVRVSFQDGFAPIDVEWTLEVTTTGTIFIDPVNGNDTTGDGTIGSPFQTINSFMKNDLTDTTYSEYQVCYRAGTHDVTADNSNTGVTAGNWQLNGTDKPLVHYPYPGENVSWDMSNTTIVVGQTTAQLGGAHGSDCYWGGMNYVGGRVSTEDPRQFAFFTGATSDVSYPAGGAGQRMTFDSPYHRDFIPEAGTNDNAGMAWAPNGYPERRHYVYIHRPTFENCKLGATATDTGVNFNGYFLASTINLLAEHITCIDTRFGSSPIISKSPHERWCIRWVNNAQAPEQQFNIRMSGSYNPSLGGPYELTYAKVNYVDSRTVAVATDLTSSSEYDPVNLDHFPAYINRCTISRVPDTNRSALRLRANWEVELTDCLFVADDLVYLEDPDRTGDFVRFNIADNPLDSSLDLTGADRTTYLGQYGAEVKNEEA